MWKWMTSNRSACRNTSSSITKCGASRSTQVGSSRRARGQNGTNSARGHGVAAGEQGDRMSLPDQLLGQVGHHPLGAPIQLRRDGLVQRRNLCNPHARYSEPGGAGGLQVPCRSPEGGGTLMAKPLTELSTNGAVRESGGHPAELGVDDPYYISAPAPLAGERDRVLNQGDTFAVFDHHGDIRPVGHEGAGAVPRGDPVPLVPGPPPRPRRPDVPQLDRQGGQRRPDRRPDQPGRPGRGPRGPAPRDRPPVPVRVPVAGGVLPAAAAAELRAGPGRGPVRPAVRGRLRRHLRGPRHPPGPPRAAT